MNQCRKLGMKMVSLLLAAAMLFTMQGVSIRAGEGDAGEREMPANPVHHCTNDGTDTTDWSYVYFGSYPQTEVTGSALTSDIIGASYDTNGDAWVGGTKYRRMKKSDANYSYTDDGYFSWNGENDYHYFKWEHIKWRVLSNDGSALFVAADKGLDCKDYNEERTSITWENCTLRSWLNSTFYNTAFSSAEQGAIISQNIVNEDNCGTEGGNNTTDKVYLLSIGEVIDPSYGFCKTDYINSASRRLKPSDYAHARGTLGTDECFWWLRSPGKDADYAALVGGIVINGGGSVDSNGANAAVVPALHIDLSSDLWSLANDGEGGDDGTGGSVTPDNGKPNDGKPDDETSNNGNVTVAKTSISGLQAELKGFTVRWNRQATASGYQVQYSTNEKFTSGAKTETIKNPSVTELNVRNLKANKKYYVRVQAYKTVNGKTYYSGWSEIKNIKPLSEEVSISKLSAKKKGFAIKWKNYNAKADGYEIAYSTSRKFAKKQTKTVTVKKRKTTSKTVSKLKAKKKYYVRIRTYRTEKINGKSKKVYSDWSKVKAVTTKK